jgi:hypothetical protein
MKRIILILLMCCSVTLVCAKTASSNMKVSLTILPTHKHKQKHKSRYKNYKVERKGNIKTIYY